MKINGRKPEPLTDNDPCPVGRRFRGVPMGKVPAWFLDWFLGHQNLVTKYPRVYEYIQRNQKRIDDELIRTETYRGYTDPEDFPDSDDDWGQFDPHWGDK